MVKACLECGADISDQHFNTKRCSRSCVLAGRREEYHQDMANPETRMALRKYWAKRRGKPAVKEYMRQYKLKNKARLRKQARQYAARPEAKHRRQARERVNGHHRMGSEYERNYQKKYRETLHDSYVRRCIAQNSGLSHHDIPKEMVELKRLQIQVHRALIKQKETQCEYQEERRYECE